MFTVIILMLSGIFLGYLTRNRQINWLGHAINVLIWILLFLLGIEAGSNEELINDLPTLGLEAGLLAGGGTLGSVVAARLLWNKFIRQHDDRHTSSAPSDRNMLQALKGSGIIVCFFFVGVCTGLSGQIPTTWQTSDISFYTLCALMGCVGWSIGHQPEMLRSFRSLNPRLAWLPLLTVIGTWTGTIGISFLLPYRNLTDCLAIGSGFGYYSLSSIFITEYKGAEMGTVALLANIIRELITLLGSPFLARWFGPLAPISAGGATTADTTLPIIIQASGQSLAVVSIFHGFAVDFSVPFLVTLWCSL